MEKDILMVTHKHSYKQKTKQKTKDPSLLLIPAIVACALVMLGSLYTALPFTMEDILQHMKETGSHISRQLSSATETLAFQLNQSKTSSLKSSNSIWWMKSAPVSTTPYVEYTGERGSVSSLYAEDGEALDQAYLFMLDTGIGPMLYYHQGDSRWGNFLYGDNDPLYKYGCGPTAVAMVINSFSPYPVDPTDLAEWSAENGYYALHSGSYHNLIPESLEAYGLTVKSVTDRSTENVSELLSSGHILVALMGQGTFTKNGHFVLITKLLDNGNVTIADPANYENCTMEWELSLLLKELKKSYDCGGPLWAVEP